MNGTALFAKGSTFRSTIDFIRADGGADAIARVLAAIPPEIRAIAQASSTTDEIDYDQLIALWNAADTEMSANDPLWMEKAGAYSIGLGGAQMYGGILRKKDPTEFLTQSVSLFRLYYHPGDMSVVENANGRAVLRLIGFDARTPLFCRRQVGGLTKALEIAGGESPVVRHVRCALEGDAFCEWELSWTQAADKVARETPGRGLELR
jgi:hypothetical protein